MDDDPLSVIANEIDNLAIYCTPQKQTAETGPWFIAGIAADEKFKGKAGDFIPKNWSGYTTHFVELGEMGLFKQEWLAETGFTHLVLLESTVNQQDAFYFGGDAITHNSVILLFKANDFYYIHCRQCALSILKWITVRQPEWEAKCPPPNSGRLN